MSRLRRAWGTPRRAAAASALGALFLLTAFLIVPPLRDLTIVAVVVSPLVAFAKFFPAETQMAMGRVLGGLAFASKSVEREAVRNDVEGTLRRGAQDLNDECEGAVPSRVHLQFLRDAESISRLADGTLVLGVAHHEDRVRNLVTAAWAFSRHAVVPTARPHLDRDVSLALNLVITKELLLREDRRAVQHFLQELWEPAIRDEKRLHRLAAILDEIQEERFLGPVALAEFVDMAIALSTRLPSPETAQESADFVEYLHGIATHEPEQDVPRSFEGRIFRCAALYVARPDVVVLGRRIPAFRALEDAIGRGYKSIYLLARGRQVEYLAELADTIASDPRIQSVTPHRSNVVTRAGVAKAQLIVRLVIDVRVFGSIGRGNYVASGGTQAAALRERVLGTRR